MVFGTYFTKTTLMILLVLWVDTVLIEPNIDVHAPSAASNQRQAALRRVK